MASQESIAFTALYTHRNARFAATLPPDRDTAINHPAGVAVITADDGTALWA